MGKQPQPALAPAQGESNVPRAGEYRGLFSAMIRSWCQAWRQRDPSTGSGQVFHFLFVQLANYLQTSNEPEESDWAELREAQFLALKTPNTGMAVAIDVGDAADIHPKNKQVPKPVAVRYAWANNPICNLYNKEGLPASPFRTDNWPKLSPAPQT